MDERLAMEPIGRLRARLLELAGITPADLDADAEAARTEVEAAYEEARDAPWPDAALAFEDVQDVGDPRGEAY